MTDVAAPTTPIDPASLPEMEPGSVALMYCTRGDVRFEFAQSLLGITQRAIPGHPIKWVLGQIASGNLAVHRNETVETFLTLGGEWMFMLDDDEQIPDDVLPKLFEVVEATGVRVVGGLYSNVGTDAGIVPMAYFVNELNRTQHYSPAQIARHLANDVKSIVVGSTGCGCLLVHRDVFLEMYEKDPGPMAWFANDIHPDSLTGTLVVQGEDHTFFRRLAAMGEPVQLRLDTDIIHFKTQAVTNDMLARAAEFAPDSDSEATNPTKGPALP